MTDSHFIVVSGVRLEARRWSGQGPPILLLLEGLGSVAMWCDFPAPPSSISVQITPLIDHAFSDRFSKPPVVSGTADLLYLLLYSIV
jgi:hypothetical protein